ncbi:MULTISPECIES: RDD family protein [Gordonia]|uniref:RDD family protein n=1 Tax=Gordonia TaxID=2053 RepID=UPI001AD7C4D7|nr:MULTISPECIES: RDD family protein [Gordonia]MDF3284597.1 RDD family protein [Gordonia sp. N1V]QTI69496.1 RDD family protein [Gordonia polyisoprenivorans]
MWRMYPQQMTYPVRPYPPVTWGRGAVGTVGVGRDDQVSGEAVALDLPAASFGLRILSGVIDLILGYLVLILGIYLSFKLAYDVDDALFGACLTVSTVIAFAAVPTTWETLTRGKTLGHVILGLRTVRDDAGPIRFRHALTRAMIGVVEIYTFFGVPAMICAAVNRRNKRIGDLVAGTYVIRERFKITLPEPIPMPPPLAPWASTADIAALPDPLAVSVRQFLNRREGYNPAARSALAERLIFAIAPYVAPAPPPQAPAEDVLAAVMAARRERDTARLAREDRLRTRLLR